MKFASFVLLPSAALAATCTEADILPLAPQALACSVASGMTSPPTSVGDFLSKDLPALCANAQCKSFIKAVGSLSCTVDPNGAIPNSALDCDKLANLKPTSSMPSATSTASSNSSSNSGGASSNSSSSSSNSSSASSNSTSSSTTKGTTVAPSDSSTPTTTPKSAAASLVAGASFLVVSLIAAM